MNYFRKAKMALLFLLCLLIYGIAGAAPVATTITSGMCTAPDITMIPVDTFTPATQPPLDPFSISQGYNNSSTEGFDFKGRHYFGHSGLDMVNAERNLGVNDITAINNGYIVASISEATSHGWGETIVIATRPNAFSDEIITHHYHHMHNSTAGTTRNYNACDMVNMGDVLGKEGKTGFANGPHLHHGIRRWQNIERLTKVLNSKNPTALLGPGYSFGDDKKLSRNLDPGGILNNTFRDYTDPTASYAWSFPFVLDMRHRGIEFGLWDGRFGAGENVTRREAARWLKIAARRSNNTPATPTFADVHKNDTDLPYIEELTHFPSANPVININANVVGSKHYFRPDDTVIRAEALKMVILSFYSAEFLELYNNWIWKGTSASASALLHQFTDVDSTDWYAPFVYFGAQKGLVAIQPLFLPAQQVKREEMAKWVSEGAANFEASISAPCNKVICPTDYFCEPVSAVCKAVPTCVPSETNICAAGGGYDGTTPTTDAGTPLPPPTADAGITPALDSGIDTGPAPALDSGITPPVADSGITPVPVCTPGDTTTCGNCGVRMCDSAGQWGTNCTGEGVCPVGANESQTCNVTGTQSRNCSAFCAWGGWSTCSVLPPPPACTDTYLASASPSCYTTPGGPTLCLAVQQVSGATWKYQVCKSGGSFVNNYKVVLGDDNHTALLSDTYTGNPGDTCSPWRNFVVGYITGYGPTNGAGVRANVLSPASCVLPACTYSTGTVTIRKECL